MKVWFCFRVTANTGNFKARSWACQSKQKKKTNHKTKKMESPVFCVEKGFTLKIVAKPGTQLCFPLQYFSFSKMAVGPSVQSTEAHKKQQDPS